MAARHGAIRPNSSSNSRKPRKFCARAIRNGAGACFSTGKPIQCAGQRQTFPAYRIQSLMQRIQSLMQRIQSLMQRIQSLMQHIQSLMHRIQSLMQHIQSLMHHIQSLM